MVDLKETINVRIEWIFAFIIITTMAVFYIAFSIINQPIQPEFIPHAVAGLVTISGVMTAFIGLWIIRIVPAEDEESMRVIPKHKKAIVVSVVIGMLVVIFGLNQLVYGIPELAYQIVLTGTLIITCMLLIIMIIVAFSEEQYKKIQSYANNRRNTKKITKYAKYFFAKKEWRQSVVSMFLSHFSDILQVKEPLH